MAWHPARNIGLKVTALILGTLLWLTVTGRQVERTVSRVPVVYRNVPAGLQITGDQTEAVTVHLRGSDSVLGEFETGQVSAVIDLGDAQAGPRRSFPLRTDEVAVPPGVEVMWVDPAQVTLTLEKSGAAKVPVVPALDGKPAPGFLVGEISVDPTVVSVAGPETRLRSIRSATTAPVLIDGARSPVSATVDVGVVDGELRLSEAQTARVTVAIVPAGSAVARTFFELTVGQRGLDDARSAILDPLRVSVVIKASPGTVGRFDPARIAPYVDLTGLGPGSYTLPVHVDADATFVVGAITPSTVKVQVR